MPDITLHEYAPFYDSSDLGPADWARIANDIRSNYLHFDGFVVLTGTDTMAYCATGELEGNLCCCLVANFTRSLFTVFYLYHCATHTALSFMLENLGKPVVFSGSQIRECCRLVHDNDA